MDSDTEDVVRGYYAVACDLGSTEDDLRALLSPDLRVVEHPNALTPGGAVRDLQTTLSGFRAGKSLLREQVFEVHEILTAGERAAVRATWRGTVGMDAGPYPAGLELVADVAALLTIRDGLVVDQETFDCYRPWS
ncbi:SnoaL-like domain-containing protein [Friedmanniella luteola]|uniref:SnoaL-like domain-containing protein n=1 Tax=Friedmanniella luteola TaxID=546871 RepID=A0A1H1SWR9_9ACTN|nr:nuclear transport factor 2 family protein [Friedmanniella luteola]SDS52435.1 SnoaL-like domain-containing protein [Friedmanniella luteola]